MKEHRVRGYLEDIFQVGCSYLQKKLQLNSEIKPHPPLPIKNSHSLIFTRNTWESVSLFLCVTAP